MDSGLEILCANDISDKKSFLLKSYDFETQKNDHDSLLLSFKNSEDREKVFLILMNKISSSHSPIQKIHKENESNIDINDDDDSHKESFDNEKNLCDDNDFAITNYEIEKFTRLWVDGAISNYEYLCRVNSCANRTKNDLSQYPVFPWVIIDYESDVLRINDDSIYRDLTKPIGAMNAQRLLSFKERYREMPEPKYLFGTHYSNPSYVVGYLFRKHPYWMLKLNGGKFDHPDRLFASCSSDWKMCINTTSCLKELIPEFYENDNSFLLNNQNIDYGENILGRKVSVSFSLLQEF